MGSLVWIVNSYDAGEMYTEYLRAKQVDAVRSSTPEEALARADHAVPPIVVTDMVFRGSTLDGPAFIRRLRGQSAFARTSIIVVSGYVGARDRRAARQAGADTFLVKPLLPQDLLGVIEAVLAAHARGERWSDEPDRRSGARLLLQKRRAERRRRAKRRARAARSRWS